MNYSAQEIFDILNEQDECTWIEAKGAVRVLIQSWKPFVHFLMNPV